MLRIVVVGVRVLTFFLIGALVAAMDSALGADPAVLPWVFVGAGLGGVVAVDLGIRLIARRLANLPPDKSRDD